MTIMKNKEALRIIDCNRNRSAEGLRVLEDISRLVLNDLEISKTLKNIRHEVVKSISCLDYSLIAERDVEGDVGSSLEHFNENKDLITTTISNSKRVEEGLRVLEEITKLSEFRDTIDSNLFKQYRFEVYELEKQITSRLIRKSITNKIHGIYIILDTTKAPVYKLVNISEQVIKGGARIIQLRDKALPKRELISISSELQKLCTEHGVLFIINDHLDIALAVETDGIHLGQTDLPISIARQKLPIDKIIGCSVQNPHQAKQAINDEVDYIAVGSIFPTKTKHDAMIIGLAGLREIRDVVEIPLVAIGGITINNCRQVIETGADSIAMVSAISESNNIEETTRLLVSMFETKQVNI